MPDRVLPLGIGLVPVCVVLVPVLDPGVDVLQGQVAGERVLEGVADEAVVGGRRLERAVDRGPGVGQGALQVHHFLDPLVFRLVELVVVGLFLFL